MKHSYIIASLIALLTLVTLSPMITYSDITCSSNEVYFVFKKINVNSTYKAMRALVSTHGVLMVCNDTLLLTSFNQTSYIRINKSLPLLSVFWVSSKEVMLVFKDPITKVLHIQQIDLKQGRIINSMDVNIPYFWSLEKCLLFTKGNSIHVLLVLSFFNNYKLMIINITSDKVKFLALSQKYGKIIDAHIFDGYVYLLTLKDNSYSLILLDVSREKYYRVYSLPKITNYTKILDISYVNGNPLILLTFNNSTYINKAVILARKVDHGFFLKDKDTLKAVLICTKGNKLNLFVTRFPGYNIVEHIEVSGNVFELINGYKNKLLMLINGTLYLMYIDLLIPKISVNGSLIHIADDTLMTDLVVMTPGKVIRLYNMTESFININYSSIAYVYAKDISGKCNEKIVVRSNWLNKNKAGEYPISLKPALTMLNKGSYLRLFICGLIHAKLNIEYIDAYSNQWKRSFSINNVFSEMIIPLKSNVRYIVINIKGRQFTSHMVLAIMKDEDVSYTLIYSYIVMLFLSSMFMHNGIRSKVRILMTKILAFLSQSFQTLNKERDYVKPKFIAINSKHQDINIGIKKRIDDHRGIIVFDEIFLYNTQCLKVLTKFIRHLSFKPLLIVSKDKLHIIKSILKNFKINAIAVEDYIESLKNIAHNSLILTLGRSRLKELKNLLKDSSVRIVNVENICIGKQQWCDDRLISEICNYLPTQLDKLEKKISPRTLKLLNKLRSEGMIYVKRDGTIDFVDAEIRKMLCGGS